MRMMLALVVLVSPTAALAFDRHHHARDLPRILGDRDPSDPWEVVPKTAYQPVTGATKSYRPVDPLPWIELNRRVTPVPKQAPPAAPKQQ